MHMRLGIDNTTRLFAVVGAPYIPERHFESGHGEGLRRASQHTAYDIATLPSSGSTNWLLHDDR